MSALQWLSILLIALGGTVAALGYLGGVAPAFDTVALARPLAYAVAVLGLVLLRAPRIVALPLLAVAVAGLLTTVMPFMRGGVPGEVTVYTKNMLYRNSALGALGRELRAVEADLVLLQEVSRRNRALLADLSDFYPHQHLCSNRGWNGLAVLSRHPFRGAGRCTAGRAAAAVEVALPTGPVWAVSVHLDWPWPYSQRRSADRVEEMVSGLEGPVILGGDLNTLPWTDTTARLERAAQGRVLRPWQASYWLGGAVPLALDHVIAASGMAERRPRLGSDHYGLLARVTP